jgi:hypothetical protein
MPKSPLLNVEHFVGPRQAFEIVGSHLFGGIWQNACVEDRTDAAHKDVVAVLRQALMSGLVRAHWSTNDLTGGGDLRPQDADHEFFSINAKDDLVFHPKAGAPVTCRIFAEDLRQFLDVQPTRRGALGRAPGQQCTKWLTKTFLESGINVPTVAELLLQARERWPGLSERSFKLARKQAIDMSGRADLAKPGRRKNPNGA